MLCIIFCILRESDDEFDHHWQHVSFIYFSYSLCEKQQSHFLCVFVDVIDEQIYIPDFQK